MSKLLFSTGTARGGTNLIVKMLNVSASVSLASDPFLPLFKSFRSAALKAALGQSVPPEAPLADHYYEEGGVERLRALYDAKLELPFDERERPALLEALTKRMTLSCENLVPLLPRLRGATYADLFREGLAMIAAAQGKNAALAGFNDNWAIEFFPALARTFPDARFLIVVRDPRASICSALRQKDSTRIAPVMSFARGWRKNVAFLDRFAADPLFAGRLDVRTYEKLVREPRRTVESLCRELGVTFEAGMLEPSNYRDGGGRVWKPNTHVHDSAPTGIFQDSIGAWEKKLPAAAVEAIELVCGREMATYGYASRRYHGGLLSPEACAFVMENAKAPASWKGAFAGVDDEIRGELMRRQLLACPPEAVSAILRASYFLFDAAYERARRDVREIPALMETR